MMSHKKKGAVYAVITLMLCFAVYLNWSYSQTQPDELQVAGQAQQELTAGKIYGETSDTLSSQADADQPTTGAAVTTQEDYFAQARTSRQSARDSAVAILQQTVDNENATEDAKTKASERIASLADRAVQESQSESMIKAKGFDEAVVFINDESVNVIVKTPQEGLTAADAAKIRDVLMGEISVSAEQIKIVEAA